MTYRTYLRIIGWGVTEPVLITQLHLRQTLKSEATFQDRECIEYKTSMITGKDPLRLGSQFLSHTTRSEIVI